MQSESETQDKNTMHDRVLAFAFTQGKYWVYSGKEEPKALDWETLKNQAWVVINQVVNTRQNMVVRNNRHQLSNGDIIRFGKVIFKVTIHRHQKPQKAVRKPASELLNDLISVDDLDGTRGRLKPAQKSKSGFRMDYSQITHSKSRASSNSRQATKQMDNDSVSNTSRSDDVIDTSPKSNEDSQKSNEKLCRICYGKDDFNNGDPLIAPCDCSGSMQLIHLKCLKHWIEDEFTYLYETEN